jgi:hypothetical protein
LLPAGLLVQAGLLAANRLGGTCGALPLSLPSPLPLPSPVPLPLPLLLAAPQQLTAPPPLNALPLPPAPLPSADGGPFSQAEGEGPLVCFLAGLMAGSGHLDPAAAVDILHRFLPAGAAAVRRC